MRKFAIMIVVPDYDAARELVPGLGGEMDDRLFEDERLRDALEVAVHERTAELARHERPRELLILRGPFTVEGGELTPTLKVKRRVIVTRYAEEIEALYERAERETETSPDEARDHGADVA